MDLTKIKKVLAYGLILSAVCQALLQAVENIESQMSPNQTTQDDERSN
jgi:hypothetical protein